MSSVPYSRYLFEPVTWYSFLIMSGAIIALLLACHEERRENLPKDTVIDLAVVLLPIGIIGARVYYIIFSWNQFENHFLSVFRIWEGGLAIYGGIIAGLITLILFCRNRGLAPLKLCDMIAPGLAVAQSIGRWGNWFNIEAYGLKITCPELCFFPFAVQVPSDAYSWHLATFFYESVWNMLIFVFLLIARRRLLRRTGDVFFFYAFLYASGRLVIEELRLDSLYASSSVRVSQLLSVILCLFILVHYIFLCRKNIFKFPLFRFFICPVASVVFLLILPYALGYSVLFLPDAAHTVIFLSVCSLLLILCLFLLYIPFYHREVSNACNES